MILEVCCADIESVRAAMAAGAQRVELCSALETGGVTPSPALTRAAVELCHAAGAKVHVLIRPRSGDYVYTPAEVAVMEEDVRRAVELGADGVVIGALTPAGDIDTETCRRLMAPVPVTFHRAFDVCRDPMSALEDIIGLGCARILTSGQEASAPEGAALISRLVEAADGRIIILAGAGVNAENAPALIAATGVSEIHASAKAPVEGTSMPREATSESLVRDIMKKIMLLLAMVLAIPALSASTMSEQEALDWLYANMPLPDVSAHDSAFFRENVRATMLARSEMPWGATVPDREFRHFVLPLRVNNENLDMARPQFYAELRDRVKGLSMPEAILEVNHWCHEKVTYQPSDGRTSSPLSAVSQAIGRCGEESTFAVAALRSVGIPARQVYTPRWAHTDDNHAWVEAWADGKWYFLGACEPEPVLNMAWFNAPASRGLLMSTNVPGDYDGPEEVLRRVPMVTTINVTSNYAPTGEARVIVRKRDGSPAKDARVDFCIYNYADLFPAATRTTDANGAASLVAGMGDMIAWATDGTDFGFAKVNPAMKEPVEIILDKGPESTGVFQMDLVPPAQNVALPAPTAAQVAHNAARLAAEDSIRAAYRATFVSADQARSIAASLGTDPEKTEKILTEARGNGHTLASFLASVEPARRPLAIDLLLSVSEKDRRDIPVDVLSDHLYNTPGGNGAFFVNYVLNPRAETEWLTPYKSFFAKEIPAADAKAWKKNPAKLAAWISANITPETVRNPQRIIMDPRAVWRLRTADARSRKVFFVSVARSLGIPARIDPVTSKTQYSADGKSWLDVDFEKASAAAAPQGSLVIAYEPTQRIPNPRYYSQFGIGRIDGGAAPVQLEFDEGEGVTELFGKPVPFDAGRYVLLSGQRMADGTVLARGEIFSVEKGKTTTVPLKIRQDTTALQVIGSVNAENIYHDLATGTDKSLLSTTGRGYYVLGLLKPNDEPSSHALNDMIAARAELEAAGNKIMLLFGSEGEMARFNKAAFNGLPETAVWGIDNNGASLAEVVESLHLPSANLPVFVVADTFNRIVFVAQGYTIGLGHRLAQILNELK